MTERWRRLRVGLWALRERETVLVQQATPVGIVQGVRLTMADLQRLVALLAELPRMPGGRERSAAPPGGEQGGEGSKS